jgi:type 1 glutamine amidotransferase
LREKEFFVEHLNGRWIMKRVKGFSVITLLLSLLIPSIIFSDGEKILVFRDAKPNDLHVDAIKASTAMLREFGTANKFSIDTTVNFSSFNSENLAKYDAVLISNAMRTDGKGGWLADTMSPSQDSALKSFLCSGKGFIGFHCFDRLNEDWPWYHELVGVQCIVDYGPQTSTLHTVNTNHPLSKGIPQTFTKSQQIRYETLFFSDTSKDFTVLITVDKNSIPADKKQTFYPYVWTHEFEGARVWCGNMGHTPDKFSSDTIWRKLILNGILYALNRPGYGPTVPVSFLPHLIPGEAEGYRQLSGIISVFDLTGRTVGTMPRSSWRDGMPLPGSMKLPFGTYIIVSNGVNRHSPVRRMPPMR